jgi:very-short-patch-repair endonuclease
MMRAFADADLIVVPQFAIGFYTVDFAIPDAMLIIECDGIYWHSQPGQVVRDRNKDAWLQRHGWTMLRLTEAEIRESPASCVYRVQTVLHSLSH